MIQPEQGETYTARQILTQMDLPDSPFFNFSFSGKKGTIQTSHVTREQLLSVPEFAASWWRYSHTTNEWCPIFHFALYNPVPIYRLVDLVTCNDDPDEWWATPKGFPRSQYEWRISS